MSILITGGNGLLGSWVSYYLAQEGKDVVSFDVKPRSFDYLKEYQDHISFQRGDVLDWSSLVGVFQSCGDGIEGIIHTPAVMASPRYWDNPYPSTLLNVVGALNLLEVARLYKVPKFLYISSGAIYGETKDCPGELTHHPNPSDLYGASKA